MPWELDEEIIGNGSGLCGGRLGLCRCRCAERDRFVWLEPPPSLGEMTVVNVRKARNLAEHAELVEQWAKVVWEAWSPHHNTVRHWAPL